MMRDRFEGPANRPSRIDVLRRQAVLDHDHNVAEAVADLVTLEEFGPGDSIITQGDDQDRRLALLLMGSTDVLVKGTRVNSRGAGEAVGEMAAIDAAATRAASVVASEPTLVAWLDRDDYMRVLDTHPQLWRAVALRVAEKLRERGSRVRQANNRSRLFIASSGEALDYARAIRRELDRDDVEVVIWKDVFPLGEYPIDSLLEQAELADFAVILATPDDVTRSRKSQTTSPRDNVVLEFGLFTGVLGRQRAILVAPRDSDIKMPSDTEGLTFLEFDPDEEPRTAMAVPSDEIRETVRLLKTR